MKTTQTHRIQRRQQWFSSESFTVGPFNCATFTAEPEPDHYTAKNTRILLRAVLQIHEQDLQAGLTALNRFPNMNRITLTRQRIQRKGVVMKCH